MVPCYDIVYILSTVVRFFLVRLLYVSTISIASVHGNLQWAAFMYCLYSKLKEMEYYLVHS